jgi:hypothetical protein
MSERVSSRCIAIKIDGTRCKLKTTKSPYCWIHLKQKEHLRIKPSKIAHAGLGLFATAEFRNREKICDYGGETVTTDDPNFGGDYVLQLTHNKYKDGRKSNSTIGGYANDARGTRFHNNAKLSHNRDWTDGILKASRNIHPNDEILTSYGRRYWRPNQRGGNIISEGYDRIKGFLTGSREGRPPSLRKFLDEHSHEMIKYMKVGRKPIQSGIEKAASILSFGKYNRNKADLQYDKLFHLFILIQFANSATYKLEKNHVVEIVRSEWNDARAQIIQLPNPHITFSKLIENAEAKVGLKQLYVYNPITGNCQIFVRDVLKDNHMLSPALEKWIMQDVQGVLKGLGYLKSVAANVTDLAGRTDILLNGKGVMSR